MKTDTQHLDFLISQYVDGCLDATSKKNLEQRLVIDPSARRTLAEHREVQDLLDDWGNRIPWINWDQFDKQLSARLEKETIGDRRATFWRRWGKVSALAASLLMAAGIGYAWRAISGPVSTQTMVGQVASPASSLGSSVIIERPVPVASSRGSMRSVGIDDFQEASGAAQPVEILPPSDVAAVEALKQTIDTALSSVHDRAPISAQPSSVTAEAGKSHPESPPFP